MDATPVRHKYATMESNLYPSSVISITLTGWGDIGHNPSDERCGLLARMSALELYGRRPRKKN